MIVLINFPRWWRFGAFAFWRWIFIRPEFANNAALIAHERAHLADQQRHGLIRWVVLYFVSKKFRFDAEVIGFAAQVKAGGGSVPWAAAAITNRYKTGCTFAQAETALIRELSK